MSIRKFKYLTFQMIATEFLIEYYCVLIRKFNTLRFPNGWPDNRARVSCVVWILNNYMYE